jgi:hypothetical protein
MAAETIFIRPGPLAAIAAGLRGRLELVFPLTRFDHQWMPPKMSKAAWDTMTRRPPFIGLGFDRFYRVQTQNDLAVISEWTLCVVVKNERGLKWLMVGDEGGPGFFSLIEVAASVLHGFTIPDIGSVQVVSADHTKIEGDEDQTLTMGVIALTVGADLRLKNVLGGEVVKPSDLTTQTIEWTFGDADTVSQTDTIINAGTS